MSHRLRVLIIALAALSSAVILQAGIVTQSLDSGLTPTDLANALVASGGGVTISNVSFTGVNRAAGAFTGAQPVIGFDTGVILGSGAVAGVVGPNNSDNFTDDLAAAGDSDLNGLVPGYTTLDATVLEFDFVPNGSAVKFQYVFTSEEYNEFVNSQYNDVFGFFINGVNYALLPDGVTPVSINNVNNGNPYGSGGANPAFYINNDVSDGGGSIDIQADGLTVVLTLIAPVTPEAVNHMKLAIADAGDHVLDSWVFVKGGSLQVAEICNNGIDDDWDGMIDEADSDCWVCSDGNLDPGEECDDGNLNNNDGCSASCKLEPKNGPPVCSTAYATPSVIWSANHKMVPVALAGITDPDDDLATIVVTAIWQDEPVLEKGAGAGNTAPDASILPLMVRAERNGNPNVPGDGRVYYIDFTATDATDLSCTGTVKICVPHDQRPGGGCVESTPLYDATHK